MEAGDDLVRLTPHPEFGFSVYHSTKSASSAPSPSRALSLGSQVELSTVETDSVLRFATDRLSQAYPLIQAEAILASRLIPPVLGGHCLSSTVNKFLSKTTSKTEVPVSAPPPPHSPHSSTGPLSVWKRCRPRWGHWGQHGRSLCSDGGAGLLPR
jgi:hypothetical protein